MTRTLNGRETNTILHALPADLAFSMQFELDLLAEGYELRRMKAGRK